MSVWFLPLVFAVQFAGAADGFRWVRAAVRLGVRLDGGAALLAIDLHGAALLGLRIAAVEAFKQVSSSMAPTLAASDTCGSTSCRCTGTRSSAAISSCSGTRASRPVGDIEEKPRELLPGATFRTAAREPTAR